MTEVIRNVRMTRKGISGSKVLIDEDLGIDAIGAEIKTVWSENLDHIGFVQRVQELLEPLHESVSVDPVDAPGYEIVYSDEHKPTCRWEVVCSCLTTITIGDPGVTPVVMSVETLMYD